MRRKNTAYHYQTGFTLIELMIVVAIVAIISSIALPSYLSYVKRGQRAELRTQMFEAAHYLNRAFAANDSFYATRSGSRISIPTELQRSPATGTQLYQMDTVNSTFGATTFKLVYVPMNGMVGDACGNFTLDSTGAKDNTGNTMTREACWK